MADVKAIMKAEREAREAEGIFEPTAEQKALLKRRNRLAEREAALKAERQAIEDSIEKVMRDGGMNALAVNGKNLALITPVTKTVKWINDGQLEEDFPEIVAAMRQYETIVENYVTIRKEPNGDRVNFR